MTKALKAYYIERARTPGDLPSWLFDEHERRPTAVRSPVRERMNNTSAPRRGRYDEDVNDQYSQPPSNRGALRDVYDRAAVQTTPKPTPSVYSDDNAGAGGSKATSRLRALRDAKRMQGAGAGAGATSNTYTQPSDEDAYGGYAGYGSGRRDGAMSENSGRQQLTPKPGLPSRPGGIRRM